MDDFFVPGGVTSTMDILDICMIGSKYLVQRFFPRRFLGNPLQCGVSGGLILQFIMKINLQKFCISNGYNEWP